VINWYINFRYATFAYNIYLGYIISHWKELSDEYNLLNRARTCHGNPWPLNCQKNCIRAQNDLGGFKTQKTIEKLPKR